MKKLSVLTTSLCAVTCAFSVFGGAAAFADNEEEYFDYYPQSFSKEVSFENLQDFAVDGEKYYFLQDGTSYEYSAERLTVLETAPDFDKCEAKGEFTLNGFLYSFDDENILTAYETATRVVTELIGFSNLKLYENIAYAVMNNALYSLNGAQSHKIELNYLDFSDTKKISADGALQALQTFSIANPSFVSLKDNAFLTKIDSNELSGETFKAGETYRIGGEITQTNALLLAQTGAENKIAIVMLGGKSYIMHADDVTVQTREAVTPAQLGATVTVSEGYLYSAPYVCHGTQLAQIKSGDPMKVIGEIKKADNPELVRDFYKVEFAAENETFTGYVPCGYVSPFTYIENDPTETPDPDYSEENLVKTVVLVIIVVVLVLAAGVFLVYTLTSDKNKKPKNKK